MKRDNKSWYGVFIFISAVILLMNISSFILSPILMFMNVSISLTLILVVWMFIKNREKYAGSISLDAAEFVGNNISGIINGIPVPLAVIKDEDVKNIVFCNSEFINTFTRNTDNFSLGSLIDPNVLKNAVKSGNFGEDGSCGFWGISYGKKAFKIYIKKINNFAILYFVDNTVYRSLKKRYIDSRICVGLILFDNKEELKRYTTEEESSRISVLVESTLRDWVKGAHGIFRKLSDEKYFVIFEDKYLKNFIENKFDIIDKMHEFKIDEHRYATVSMGISRGELTLLDAEAEARNALNMSLGRGGDQVTIKKRGSYEFFGGTSQGLEKRSKVKTRVVAMALLEKIQESDCVFIMGHKYSDFDSIGAAAALWNVCVKAKKKKAYVVVDKSQSLAGSAIEYLEKFSSGNMFISPDKASALVSPKSLLIIVDTHSLKFLESAELYSKINNVAVIDHHRMTVDKINNVEVLFHEPFASSACEMVTEMVQYMCDGYLKKVEAECLLAGIMLDTKNFTLKSGIRTFEAAAYLKKKGAESAEVKKMFGSSLDMYKLKYQIISGAHIFENVVISRLETSDIKSNIRVACSQAADELLNLKNIKASFVLFESDGKINVSARSLGDINVQLIMESLGGGGHQTMAAAQIADKSFDEVEEELIRVIKEKMNI